MAALAPRIIHLIPHDGIGGVETAARVMATSTVDCDFRLMLIAGKSLAGDTRRILESPWRSPLNPFAQLRAVALCLREAPDVLICSLWRSIAVAVIARVLCRRIRLVVFLNLDRPAHFVDAFVSRLGILVADEIWADSGATLRARLGHRRKPSRVISFVTERLEAAAPASGTPMPHFVSWSRLNRQKGIDRALSLIAELRNRGVDARFDLWGPDDGEQGRLETQAQALGIASHVLFRGAAPRDRLSAIAADASFFVQLSRFEGMAMGTVEAMQLGLVPIVTPVGEMGDYVSDGINGLIVDANDIGAAADRVAALLADPDLYGALRGKAVSHWAKAPLYAEDVCGAAADLVGLGAAPGAQDQPDRCAVLRRAQDV